MICHHSMLFCRPAQCIGFIQWDLWLITSLLLWCIWDEAYSHPYLSAMVNIDMGTVGMTVPMFFFLFLFLFTLSRLPLLLFLGVFFLSLHFCLFLCRCWHQVGKFFPFRCFGSSLAFQGLVICAVFFLRSPNKDIRDKVLAFPIVSLLYLRVGWGN